MLYNNIFGVIGLAALANGHMIMNTPVPYGKSTLNSSPLAADGSDFPCKQRTGVYDAEGADNVMTLGGSYELAFTGSAVHGGGSCQVSITYDEKPTAKSTFKVIKSYIGGCPMRGIAGNNGNNAAAVDPDTYNFTIPADLPAGKGTLVWTWFNKIGNREMYQNCAPVTLSGGSSKRDVIAERDNTFYNSLPDMFVANIGNGCGTADSLDVVFPNPGTAVDYDGGATSTATAAPTGSCQAATGGNSPATATAVPTSAAAAPVASSSASALSGGVFATVAPSASASAASVSAASATVAPAASAAPASSAAPVEASSVASAAAPASTGSTGTTGTTGITGSGAQLTGACTSEGEFNCIGGSSFQQCASGTWSVVQAMAAGTTCTSGQSKSLTIAKRFTSNNRHVARRALGAEMFV
ncbi:glycoside hydrolase protein [Rutstroemia sp. NJR-2017a WRK4]|nr:glycoside hydrolase protein [Rutstroemia sp. NJR-2017a WRK4]